LSVVVALFSCSLRFFVVFVCLFFFHWPNYVTGDQSTLINNRHSGLGVGTLPLFSAYKNTTITKHAPHIRHVLGVWYIKENVMIYFLSVLIYKEDL
jgi:hypothetical protein